MNVLDPAGHDARILGQEITVQLVAGCAVYLIVVGLLVAIVVRQRRIPSEGEPLPEEESGARWIWIGGLILPLVVITGLVAMSVRSLSAVAGHPPRGAAIDVIGHRWWWEVRYPGEGIVTANHLALPVGRPVHLRLQTHDVIHSFWIPQLGRKLDMVPGQLNTMDMTAEKPGTYSGECYEFCGLQHARMRFTVDAMTPDAYAAWKQREQRPAAAPASASARRGQAVFDETCAACHTIKGTPAAGQVGPDLTHLASRRAIAAGTLHLTRGALGKWITDPQDVKRGANMPATALSGRELQDLLDYLEGLR